MSTIESLEKRYVGALRTHDELLSLRKKVKKRKRNETPEEAFLVRMSALDDYIQSVKSTADLHHLPEIYRVGVFYRNCLRCLDDYRNKLLNAESGNADSLDINQIGISLKNAQSEYYNAKTAYYEKTKEKIDSTSDLYSCLEKGISVEIDSVENRIEGIKEKARNLLEKEFSLDLKNPGFLHIAEELPDTILAAGYKAEENRSRLLNDLGITETYVNIVNDIRNQGNIYVSTEFEYISDAQIDNFTISYILRYLESFPLGTVHIHIFDRNANYLIRRLCSSFASEKLGEDTRKVIQLHNNLNDIYAFRDVTCEDIIKKISVEAPDLYSIHQKGDKTDAFNLLVLRNGLVDSSGYASSDILDAVNMLTKTSDIGHKCGIRFLIIDDAVSFEKNLNANIKFKIASIKNNCGLQFSFSKGHFINNGRIIEPLHIVDNIDLFIQEKSNSIAQAISDMEKSYIPYSEVVSAVKIDKVGSILYIPVGKSGNDTVRLPFSCKDDNGTVEGQCIGYMAIGQSGSGKSSFFHSIVVNGCLMYSPKDLQFWLLDFKFGGSSSKYRNSGLPHIHIIAENNKIEDALCLFQMVEEEMNRRNRAFNEYFVDNIVDYNNKVEEENRFPRIIIAIDEVQEIFRDDNATELKNLISSISVRMRSSGIHFIMIAQNLTEGKSYMLKEAFLPSASGRICFRVAEKIPRESGFDNEFAQRAQEISELKTGEAYVSYGKGTIKKVKMAYASPEQMNNNYFKAIRLKNIAYSYKKPLVLGSRKRLSVLDSRQRGMGTYSDSFRDISYSNGEYIAVIGEDSYRLDPLNIKFSKYDNSSLLLLGSDKEIASSLCTSLALALMRQKAKVHLVNGDRNKSQIESKTFQHPFMYLCEKVENGNNRVNAYRPSQFKDVLKGVYSEYLRRYRIYQEADDIPEFPAEFLIINDLFGIESFSSNEQLDIPEEHNNEIPTLYASRRDGKNNAFLGINRNNQNGLCIQEVMYTLLKKGFNYNIYLIIGIKGDASIWRNFRITSDINHIVLFNIGQYTDQLERPYYVKEMLKNIANKNNEETMAVWIDRHNLSKFRPFIYKMSERNEVEAVDTLISEGNNETSL